LTNYNENVEKHVYMTCNENKPVQFLVFVLGAVVNINKIVKIRYLVHQIPQRT
jgi:hypothetical protein